MASASTAISGPRSSGLIDLRRPAEYPIILGDSLKQDSDSQDRLLNLRYNWQPKAGFGDRRAILTATERKGCRLVVKNENDSNDDALVYSGRPGLLPVETIPGEKPSSLALVFDHKKSAFILERISTSLDLNLISAPGQSSEEVRNHPQIPMNRASNHTSSAKGGDRDLSDDNETPDPSNPFDYRHFLAEAKENAERGHLPGGPGGRTPLPGATTPLPGSRTPLSGFASPVTGASRFLSTTPQFRPTPTSAPIQRKKSPEREAIKRSKKQASPPSVKQRQSHHERKSSKPTHQPLSKERISDSDEELSDTITIVRPSASLEVAQPKPRAAQHTRQISSGSGFGHSPHIVVNDGDLEIDMGSPPPESALGRRRPGRVDPGAFRSHTGTPNLGVSSHRDRDVHVKHERGRTTREADNEDDDDVRMKDSDANEEEEDADVEELALGSPRTTNRMSLPGSADLSMHEHAPTPTNPNLTTTTAADDDDEDLLAAELEAALEAEDNENEAAGAARSSIGLGIGIGIGGSNPHQVEDDESEVSEEE